MKTLKSKFIAGATALTLLLGSFFIVNAMAKKVEVKQTSYKWFQISSSTDYDTNEPVAQSDAAYVGEGTTPPMGNNCSTNNPHQCVSGFSSDQVNPSTNELIDDNQVPKSTPRTRN